MNTNQLEQLLLFEQSGELSPKQRQTLDAELAASAQARRLRDELRGLAAAIPSLTAQPAPDAAQRIASRLKQERNPAFTLFSAWKPALAAAAALALLLGVRAYRAPAPIESEPAVAQAEAEEDYEWTDPLDADFTELENLLATIDMDDPFEITEL